MSDLIDRQPSQKNDSNTLDALECVSRKAAIEFRVSHGLNEDGRLYVSFDEVRKYLEQLPSVQPERKRGKWVKMTGMMPPEYFGHYECSECGWHLSHHDKTKENELGFCPNCGADMRGEENG